MQLLPGSFEPYQGPTELEPAPKWVLDKAPLRPVLAASVLLALVVGAAGYLRTSMKAKQQPSAPTSASAVHAESPGGDEEVAVIIPGLQPDAIQHARSIARLVDRAIADLSAAEASLNKVRPYAGTDVDQAEDKVESACRSLASAREQAKVVRALVGQK